MELLIIVCIAGVSGSRMGPACHSEVDLCGIFDQNTLSRGYNFTQSDILPKAKDIPVKVAVQSNSLGTTNVARDQLTGMWPPVFEMVSASTPRVLFADNTGGVVTLTKATQNAIPYAACGQSESALVSPSDFTSFRQIGSATEVTLVHLYKVCVVRSKCNAKCQLPMRSVPQLQHPATTM